MYSSVLVYLNPLFCLLLDALLHAALYIKGPCFFVISLITVAQLSSTVESTAQTLNRNTIYPPLLRYWLPRHKYCLDKVYLYLVLQSVVRQILLCRPQGLQ